MIRSLPLALGLLCAGCQTKLTDRQYFVARDSSTGEVSVLRVTIDAYAEAADLEFRAGFVPSTAIDEVVRGKFDHIFAPSNSQTDAIQAAQKHAIEKALNDLRVAYEQPWETGKSQVKAAEDKLLEARTLLNRSDDRATREKPEAPEEKFVIAVAANPDAVFNAFAAAAGQQTQQDNMVSAVARLRRQTELQRSFKDESARLLWEQLAPAAPVGDDADLRARLAEYSTRLNDFLIAAP